MVKIKRPRFCCGCLAIPIIVIIFLGAGLPRALQPVSTSRKRVKALIPVGSTLWSNARELEAKGIIRSAPAFAVYAYITGSSRHIRAGEYRLSPGQSSQQILERLLKGGASIHSISVTIPEGYTIHRIAGTLQEKGVISDSNAFIKLASSGTSGLAASFPLPDTGLEGYLYPDTYQLERGTRPELVAQKMIESFDRMFYQSHKQAIMSSTHSLHAIVTIASLIEREAQIDADRPRIAGVIENRMRRHMKLDIDATVLYALGYHKSRVLYKDLKVQSPYNTYLHKGLPPGPIASPGLLSLEAALTPEQHQYLYYVAVPDGSHLFACTKAEHDRNVIHARAMRTATEGAPHAR